MAHRIRQLVNSAAERLSSLKLSPAAPASAICMPMAGGALIRALLVFGKISFSDTAAHALVRSCLACGLGPDAPTVGWRLPAGLLPTRLLRKALLLLVGL